MRSPGISRFFSSVAFLVLLSLVSACSSLTEQERLEKQTTLAEKRELWAYKRQACEDSVTGAWMCTGSSKAAKEQSPWLYCGCADNGRVLER
jgi:hypothetical protein